MINWNIAKFSQGNRKEFLNKVREVLTRERGKEEADRIVEEIKNFKLGEF